MSIRFDSVTRVIQVVWQALDQSCAERMCPASFALSPLLLKTAKEKQDLSVVERIAVDETSSRHGHTRMVPW